MNARRAIAVVVASTLAGLLLLLWLARPGPLPPVLNLASIEPAGLIDDSGSEMWLMTLTLSNSYAGRFPESHSLFVKDSRIEAKVTNRWVGVEGTLGTLGTCSLPPTQKCRRLLLLPAGTDACRVRFKYAGAHLAKGHLASVASHLPLAIRRRIPYQFWRWVGFPNYGPSSVWRDAEVDLSIRRPFGPSM